jgi:hypothetical protein
MIPRMRVVSFGGETTGNTQMINRMPALVAGALLAARLATFTNGASAAPLSGALALANAVPSHVETVGWGGGRGWGEIIPVFAATAGLPPPASPGWA